MKMNTKGNDNFRTPDFIFEQLDNIFNFELDVAADSSNAKCSMFFSESDNALKLCWGGVRCFCNPPFSQKAAFIKKAHDEVLNGNCPICVMVLPLNSMDTKAFHQYIQNKFIYEVLEGRISFIDPTTNKPKSGNNSGTVIVYFKKKISTKDYKNDK